MAILPKSSGVVVTASAWAQSAKEKITPVIEKSKVVAVNTFNTTKAILDRYPPLKAFAVSLVVFSLIPLAFFLAFALSSGAVVLGIAGTGVAVVEGTFLAVGGFFLFWFLAGALLTAGIASFWFTAIYFGFQTAKKVAKKE